ncbi:MAG: DNA-binding transcriptional regulator [Thermoguttaceae bacterium]
MVYARRRIRHVALLVEWSRAFGRGVLRGIGRYVQAHGRWKVYHTERKLSEAAPQWLRAWQGDGVIARIENQALAAQLRQLQIPMVNLFERGDMDDVPAVLADNQAIARLAADHLVERGLKNFAYCGLPGLDPSGDRGGPFAAYLAGLGHTVHVFDPPGRRRSMSISASEDYELRREDTLGPWLCALPKPVGLMACNDLRAHQVLMACDENHLAVPEEVAVLGVDNDEAICGLSCPPLSSVEQNSEEAGYQAASLLDRLMEGETLSGHRILIEPRGVVARQSTDVVAVADADLAAILHYIREHACAGLTVDDLSVRMATSRRTLERRFAALMGCSPKDEIARVQIGHVKQLLAMTDYPLTKIAELTGFRYVESMFALFKRTVGVTPGQYRREVRSQ